jgi:hypothetical protein
VLEDCQSNEGVRSPVQPVAFNSSSGSGSESQVRSTSATGRVLLPAVRALQEEEEEEELVHLFAADQSPEQQEHFRSLAMDRSKLAVLLEQHREHIMVNELVLQATGVFVERLRAQPDGAVFRSAHLTQIEHYIRAVLTEHWGQWDAAFGSTLHQLLQRYENLETDFRDELLQDISNVLYDEMVFSSVQYSSVQGR